MPRIYDRGLVELMLVQMRECVEGDNFVILSRTKNDEFISEYALNRRVQRTMLLGLTVDDYCGCDESRNFAGRFVHKFCINIELRVPDGHTEKVDVYIKFEIEGENAEEQTVVISLHKSEHPVYYLFR